MKITELDLVKLGFEKHVVSPEESGDATGYYYYELELSACNSDFCLISMESDDVKDDDWKVKLFQTDDYLFDNRVKLAEFIQSVVKFRTPVAL